METIQTISKSTLKGKHALKTLIYSYVSLQSFSRTCIANLMKGLSWQELTDKIYDWNSFFSKSLSHHLSAKHSKTKMVDDKWGKSTKEVQSLISLKALFRRRTQQYAHSWRPCLNSETSDYKIKSKLLTNYDIRTESGAEDVSSRKRAERCHLQQLRGRVEKMKKTVYRDLFLR